MSARASSILAAVTLALGALSGCDGADPATQLVVVVDSDLHVPSRIDRVAVTVTGPAGTPEVVEQMLGEGAPELPLTLGVSPSGPALGPVTITADAFLGDSRIVTRTARTTLVRGRSLTLYLFLASSCVGTDCPEEETCTSNGCMPVEIDPEELPDWTGRPPMRDGGMPDGGTPVDGGGTDAARPDCTTAAHCDDGNACTIDLCDEGLCTNAPDDALCTDGPDGFCDAVNGCQYSECTAATCVAAPCGTAMCDGSTCVRTSLCGTGETCCAGSCVPAGCDDGNACTDDACGAAGCENVDNTAPCDDGMYCNGPDTCAGGACGTHAGSPCSGSAVCDESADVCTGCLTNSDCGAPVYGSWGACEGFSDSCDESGTRSRSVTSFTCSSGTCTPSSSTESEACTRSTGGNTCGATTCGSYGSCGGFSDACDEMGTRSRECTDYVCSGGSCTTSNRTETSGCSRDTDGTSCGATTCGAWGACGGFADDCVETGTQNRTCTTYTCAAGSCGTAMMDESQGCTRSTNGYSCDDGVFRTCGDYCYGGLCNAGEFCARGCICDPAGFCTDDGSGTCLLR